MPPQPPHHQLPEDAPDLWSRWGRARILVLALALLLGNFSWQFFTAALGGGLFAPIIVGAALGVVLPLVFLGRDQGLHFRRDLDLNRPPLPILALAAFVAAACLAPASLLAEVSALLRPVDPSWVAAMQDELPAGLLGRGVAVLAAVVAAPVAEEIIFRGLIYRVARATWGPLPAMALSSVVFGLVHFEPWYVFGLIGVGAMLAFIYEATGSLTACIVAHAVHNAVSVAVIMFTGEMASAGSPPGRGDILFGAVSLAAAVLTGRLLWRSCRPDDRG